MQVGAEVIDTVQKQRKVFVSYAHIDQSRVEEVVEGLRQLGTEVWLDRALVGGQEWWDEILQQVRDSDVFLQIISRAALESEGCTRERAYARALGKPLLPVIIERIPTALLPSDLARLQCVDYTDSSPQHAFALVAALSRCPETPPLPHALPPGRPSRCRTW